MVKDIMHYRLNIKIFLFFIFIYYLTNITFSQDKLFFDVKTKMIEKIQLTHIKSAVGLLLLESNWASVTEIGENYALWLKNYHKEFDGNSVKIYLDIEIREPSAWGEGRLIDPEPIVVIFNFQDDIQRVSNHYELFKQKFHNISDKLLLETTLVSEKIEDKLFYMSHAWQ
jgi:hypothetical protein